MPWFADAYLADTRHLTLEEHGAYRLLLDIAWRTAGNTIPDNDKRIAQMLGITAGRWAKLKPAVMGFWELVDGGWKQKKLTKVFRNARERREKCSDAANQRWQPKSLKTKSSGNANAHANGYANENATINHNHNQGSNEPIASPTGDVSAEPTERPLTSTEIVEAWNQRMVPQGFPAVKRLTGTRQRQLKARLRENTIDDWQQAMAALERSAFCRGENDRGWRADFDFLLQPKSFTKLLEGAYDH